jgi:hypothetical protein
MPPKIAFWLRLRRRFNSTSPLSIPQDKQCIQHGEPDQKDEPRKQSHTVSFDISATQEYEISSVKDIENAKEIWYEAEEYRVRICEFLTRKTPPTGDVLHVTYMLLSKKGTYY